MGPSYKNKNNSDMWFPRSFGCRSGCKFILDEPECFFAFFTRRTPDTEEEESAGRKRRMSAILSNR